MSYRGKTLTKIWQYLSNITQNIKIMSGPFKMKGWSPFTQKTHPDHPVTPPKKQTEVKEKKGIRDRWQHPLWIGGTGLKGLIKEAWKKHGPVINPSTKNPKGVGK